MHKIVMISNDYKTVFQLHVAEELRSRGWPVEFVCFNRYFSSLVEGKGFNVTLVRFTKAIKNINSTPPSYSIKELVDQDPALRGNGAGSEKYLLGVRSLVLNKYKKEKGVKTYFIGESSRGHESLISRMCEYQEINGVYLTPCTARYPSNKFFIFTKEYQLGSTSPVKCNILPNDDFQPFSQSSPKYFQTTKDYLVKKSSWGQLIGKLYSLWVNPVYDIEDVHFSKGRIKFAFSRLQHKLRSIVYNVYVKRINTAPEGDGYVLLPLQRDPESTVDVLGRYNEDQFKLVKDVSRWVPYGIKVYVKEHKTALGDRPLSFYRKISTLDNVFILNENLPARQLIKKSDCVISVSGTVTLEALELGIPSLILSNIYISSFPGVGVLSSELFRIPYINHINKLQKEKNSNFLEFYKSYILHNCFDGYVGDHLTEPYVLDPENINSVANAFESVLLNNE